MNLAAEQLLRKLNTQYAILHRQFEEMFWLFQMGDHDKNQAMNGAERIRDSFRSDPARLKEVSDMLTVTDLDSSQRERLTTWLNFFKLYQTPPELVPLRDKIATLEGEVAKKTSNRKEGYKDPTTGKFIEASRGKMSMIMRINSDEAVRKACFDALEEMSLGAVEELVQLVAMRNEYARALGFEDFYAYKLKISEGMEKGDVFTIFNAIYEKTKYALDDIRKLEESKPGLRKPWNFGHMMSGSFTLEEDPYYDFGEALLRWGRSFAALGIDYRGGTLQLDLLDRKGKHDNGFCHYPELVSFNNGKRNSGGANFTCNVVYGQPGSGFFGMETLFHEGGHAADRLASEQTEVCLNTEYPPASIAWAETHSQFLDTMFSSIEWRTRYAKDNNGNSYPFELFERKVRQVRMLAPTALYSIMMVSEFEKRMYEEADLTVEKIIGMAKEVSRKYYDYSEDSLTVLSVPHIYSWETSAYYHAYGLSELALHQWHKYFYDKYGYVVDNPNVGKELIEVWKLGSAKLFPEFVKLATGRELSPEAFLENVTMDIESFIDRAKNRIEKMKTVPEYRKTVNLNAHIRMLNGKELVADNSVSFEDMAEKYKAWLQTQKTDS